LDQALQRQAHRVVKIGGGEVGAAELQLGDEAHEKYAALLKRQAAQTDRSCESVKTTIQAWSGHGDGCQRL
jgi:hypothetical protein